MQSGSYSATLVSQLVWLRDYRAVLFCDLCLDPLEGSGVQMLGSRLDCMQTIKSLIVSPSQTVSSEKCGSGRYRRDMLWEDLRVWPCCMSLPPPLFGCFKYRGGRPCRDLGVVTCVSPVAVFATGIKIFDWRKIDLITWCLSEALDCLVYRVQRSN